MDIKDECWWYKNDFCDAGHCSDCEKWYDYYRKQKGCTPT